MEKIIEVLARELNISKNKVENTVKLIDEGNTIPFIARYRKEVTGNLDDEILRNLNDRLNYLRNLEKRKEEVLRLIEEQGKLTEELKESILNAAVLTEVEDLYRPYKQKKRTRATIAKEKGLEPLAKLIISQTLKDGNKEEIVKEYINIEKGVKTTEDAIAGALDIIAEDISDNARFRKKIRGITYRTGKLVSSAVDKDESTVYDMYYNFSEELKKIPSHRILAINRGEKEEFLKVKFEVDEEKILGFLESKIIIQDLNINEQDISILNNFYFELQSNSFDDLSLSLYYSLNERIFFISIKNGYLIIKGNNQEEKTIYTTLQEDELSEEMHNLLSKSKIRKCIQSIRRRCKSR